MSGPALPPPYTTRPLRRTDAAAVTAVTTAYEERVLGEQLVELADVEAEWQRPKTDLARRSAAVFDATAMVAYAEVSLDKRSEAFVHPGHWGRGLGAALARWSWQVGVGDGLDRVGQTVPDADGRAGELFAALGYQRHYRSWLLALPGDARIPSRRLPIGYRMRDLVLGHDDRAAYELIERAFGEFAGRVPATFDDWAAMIVRRPAFDPSTLRVVESPTGRIVAACVLVLTETSTGWVQQLAVDRAERGQGLAQALLADAFATARRRGRPRAELSNDSRTGAIALYEKVGMRVTCSFTHWARSL